MDYITSQTNNDENSRRQQEPLSHTLLTTNLNSNRDPFEQRVVYIEPRPSASRVRRTSNNTETRRRNPFLEQPVTYLQREEQWQQRLSYEARLAHQFEWEEDEEFVQLLTSDDTTLFTSQDFLTNWNQLQNYQQQRDNRTDAVSSSSRSMYAATAVDLNSHQELELPPPSYESLLATDDSFHHLSSSSAERDPFAQRIIYFEPLPRSMRSTNNSSLSQPHSTRHRHQHPGGNGGPVDEFSPSPPPSYESLFGTHL